MKTDRRSSKSRPWAYVVCTDVVLSGWGYAPGRSLYALAVDGPREAETVIENAMARSDMRRPRIVRSFASDGTPKVRMRHGDHMSIVDRSEASRWYEPGGFSS